MTRRLPAATDDPSRLPPVLCTPIQLVVRGQGKRTLHAARSQAFLAAKGDKGADIGWPQFGESLLAHRAADMVRLKSDEPRHIIAIGAQGMG